MLEYKNLPTLTLPRPKVPPWPGSPIMEKLRIAPVLFVDIGGYLFPDNPGPGTKPNQVVVNLTKKHTRLWGPESCFIAANTSIRKNMVKDLALLHKYDVYRRTGIPSNEHFIECNGPEEKGPLLLSKILILQRRDYKVLPVICDNRLLVAMSCPEETHCFIFNEKDSADFGVRIWLAQPHNRLYRVIHTGDIGYKSLCVHLEFIKDVALKNEDNHDPIELQSLYAAEVKRTRSIFQVRHRDLPDDLQHL